MRSDDDGEVVDTICFPCVSVVPNGLSLGMDTLWRVIRSILLLSPFLLL